MTCRLAFSYSRDVYAMPGRVDDIRSQGCNLLIGQKIAEPIISTASLLEGLGMKASAHSITSSTGMLPEAFRGKISDEALCRMNLVIELIRKNRGITVEELPSLSGLSYRNVAEAVNLLEIEGFICVDILQRCSINYKNA